MGIQPAGENSTSCFLVEKTIFSLLGLQVSNTLTGLATVGAVAATAMLLRSPDLDIGDADLIGI